MPTNAAIATRPCLISAWRKKPIVASWLWSQNSPPARFSGSQYPTTGLSSFAKVLRSSMACMVGAAVRARAPGLIAGTWKPSARSPKSDITCGSIWRSPGTWIISCAWSSTCCICSTAPCAVSGSWHVDHLVRLVQHLLHLLHSAMRRLGLLLNLLQRELHEARHLPHDLQLLLELPRILKHRLHL